VRYRSALRPNIIIDNTENDKSTGQPTSDPGITKHHGRSTTILSTKGRRFSQTGFRVWKKQRQQAARMARAGTGTRSRSATAAQVHPPKVGSAGSATTARFRHLVRHLVHHLVQHPRRGSRLRVRKRAVLSQVAATPSDTARCAAADVTHVITHVVAHAVSHHAFAVIDSAPPKGPQSQVPRTRAPRKHQPQIFPVWALTRSLPCSAAAQHLRASIHAGHCQVSGAPAAT